MRARAVGLGLLGLGAFLLAGALATLLFLAPALVTLPLNTEAHPVAVAAGADFFNLKQQQQHQGEAVTVRQKVVGVPGAKGAGGSVAVWAFGSTVEDSTNTLITPPTSYQVCLDRKTAASVDCPSAQIAGQPAKIHGLTLNFPFDVQKKSYDVFDANVDKAFPARFAGVDTIQGIAVYKFTESIPETVAQTQTVPGAMAGAPGTPSVVADVVYSNERTLWVEPTSGVIVNIEEHPKTVFRAADGTPGVTFLAGTFTGDAKTVADGVDRASTSRSQIMLVRRTLPWTLFGLGLVALVGGALMVRRARSGVHRRDVSVGDENLAPTQVAPVQ